MAGSGKETVRERGESMGTEREVRRVMIRGREVAGGREWEGERGREHKRERAEDKKKREREEKEKEECGKEGEHGRKRKKMGEIGEGGEQAPETKQKGRGRTWERDGGQREGVGGTA